MSPGVLRPHAMVFLIQPSLFPLKGSSSKPKKKSRVHSKIVFSMVQPNRSMEEADDLLQALISEGLEVVEGKLESAAEILGAGASLVGTLLRDVHSMEQAEPGLGSTQTQVWDLPESNFFTSKGKERNDLGRSITSSNIVKPTSEIRHGSTVGVVRFLSARSLELHCEGFSSVSADLKLPNRGVQLRMPTAQKVTTLDRAEAAVITERDMLFPVVVHSCCHVGERPQPVWSCLLATGGVGGVVLRTHLKVADEAHCVAFDEKHEESARCHTVEGTHLPSWDGKDVRPTPLDSS